MTLLGISAAMATIGLAVTAILLPKVWRPFVVVLALCQGVFFGALPRLFNFGTEEVRIAFSVVGALMAFVGLILSVRLLRRVRRGEWPPRAQ